MPLRILVFFSNLSAVSLSAFSNTCLCILNSFIAAFTGRDKVKCSHSILPGTRILVNFLFFLKSHKTSTENVQEDLQSWLLGKCAGWT